MGPGIDLQYIDLQEAIDFRGSFTNRALFAPHEYDRDDELAHFDHLLCSSLPSPDQLLIYIRDTQDAMPPKRPVAANRGQEPAPSPSPKKTKGKKAGRPKTPDDPPARMPRAKKPAEPTTRETRAQKSGTTVAPPPPAPVKPPARSNAKRDAASAQTTAKSNKRALAAQDDDSDGHIGADADEGDDDDLPDDDDDPPTPARKTNASTAATKAAAQKPSKLSQAAAKAAATRLARSHEQDDPPAASKTAHAARDKDARPRTPAQKKKTRQQLPTAPSDDDGDVFRAPADGPRRAPLPPLRVPAQLPRIPSSRIPLPAARPSLVRFQAPADSGNEEEEAPATPTPVRRAPRMTPEDHGGEDEPMQISPAPRVHGAEAHSRSMRFTAPDYDHDHDRGRLVHASSLRG